MALNCISEGGTGVRRVKILSQDLVTSEIPVYERFLPRRAVRPSIWGASQHFSQKWLIFSVRKVVPAGAVSLAAALCVPTTTSPAQTQAH